MGNRTVVVKAAREPWSRVEGPGNGESEVSDQVLFQAGGPAMPSTAAD